jgi:hypothetical protein
MFTNVKLLDRLHILGAFATAVRRGSYARKGKQVTCATVQVALRAIGATFELAGEPNPTYIDPGNAKYHLRIKRQLEGYRRADPPPAPQMAVPVRVVNYIYNVKHHGSSFHQALADICLIAFYFLLRVGEYTTHKKGENRRTKQFRACDITFWDKHKRIIPIDSPLEDLLKADSVTMRIDNQKNGVRGGMINHSAIHTIHCPVKALARRVHHIISHSIAA